MNKITINSAGDNRKLYYHQSTSVFTEVLWRQLMEMALSMADSVAFNILRRGYEKCPEIVEISGDLILKKKGVDKFYSSGFCVMYKLSTRVKEFVFAKRYNDWNNFYFEDISFFLGAEEFFATITHENYVVIWMSEVAAQDLNSKGYNFLEF